MPDSPKPPPRGPIDRLTLTEALAGDRLAMQQVVAASSVIVTRVIAHRLAHVDEARRPELRRRCLLGAWRCLVEDGYAVLEQWLDAPGSFEQFVFDAVSTWIDGITLPTLASGRALEWKPELVRAALDDRGSLGRQLASYIVEHLRSAAVRVLQSHRRRIDVVTEAEDMVQGFAVKLFEKDCAILRGWDPALGRKLSSYLFLIGRNYVFGQLRKQTRKWWLEPYDPDNHDHGQPMSNGEQDIEALLHRELEYQALRAQLDPEERRLLDLLYSGASLTEAADALGITPNNCYQRKHRLLKKIKTLRAERHDHHDE